MNLQLHIKENNEFTSERLMGDYANSFDEETNYTTYDLGTVQYQQSRDIVLNIDNNSNFEYFYTYKIGGQCFKSETQIINTTTEMPISSNIEKHILRYTVVERIRQMMNYNRINQNTEAMKIFDDLVSHLKSSSLTDALTQGLLKNLIGDDTKEGQIMLATSNMEYFRKWGEFYIDQLSRAMNQQIKPNFKDPGCPFGGKVFEGLVDKSSDIFDSLPPPKPSLTKQKYGGSAPARTVNMSSFNNMYGGCFDSECVITMADGSNKVLKNLKKGDQIMSVDQNNAVTTSNIVCVFEIKVSAGIREFVEFEDGL